MALHLAAGHPALSGFAAAITSPGLWHTVLMAMAVAKHGGFEHVWTCHVSQTCSFPDFPTTTVAFGQFLQAGSSEIYTLLQKTDVEIHH